MRRFAFFGALAAFAAAIALALVTVPATPFTTPEDGVTLKHSVSPAQPRAGQEITFTNESIADGADIGGEWWDFDADGRSDAYGPTATHTFAEAGDYWITYQLNAADLGLARRTFKLSVLPPNQPPFAGQIVADPAEPETGEEVALSLDTQGDPDGEADIVSRAWDLDDDGQFDDATGPTATVTFDEAGEHTVHFRIEDQAGAWASSSLTLDVTEAPPATACPTDLEVGEWTVVGNTVCWAHHPQADRYKLAYRQGTSGPAQGYLGAGVPSLYPPSTSHTFFAPPGSMQFPFQVAWTWYDGQDHWSGEWLTVTAPGAEPPPTPPGEEHPTAGTAELIWSQPDRQVTCRSGEHTCTNNFIRIPEANDARHFIFRYGATFPSSWRWSSGGFKMPGPGGESSGGVVPNGCELNNGWSGRDQYDGNVGGADRARIAAYLYLQDRNPPEINGLDVQATSNGSTPCGTIIRNPSAGIVRAGDRVDVEKEFWLNTPGQDDGRLAVRVRINGGPEQTIIDHDRLDFGVHGLSHAIPVVYFGGTNVSPQTQTMTLHNPQLWVVN